MSNWLKHLQPRHWGRLARAILGDLKFDYQPPSWAAAGGEAVHRSMRRNPAAWASCIVTIGVLSVAGLEGWRWWEAHKPRLRQLVEVRESSGSISAPAATTYVKGKAPEVYGVGLNFSTATAPLDLIGKPVPTALALPVAAAVAAKAPAKDEAKATPQPLDLGFSIVPQVAGTWEWRSGSYLVFKPKSPWPAGASYTITADAAKVSSSVKLKQTSWSFTTPALEVSWRNTEFYTDPKDPTTHQVVAELFFSQPVMLKDVEQHLSVNMLGKSALFGSTPPAQRFTVLPGKDEDAGFAQTFYVRTQRLVLPEVEDHVNLKLTAAIGARSGGATTTGIAVAKVRVPDIYTGFFIREISSEIVPSSEGEPQQFLFINTEGYVASSEIAKNVKVWLLPKDRPALPARQVTNGKATVSLKAEPLIKDYDWPNVGEVTPEIMALAKPVTLQAIELEKDDEAPMATRHAFKYLVERTGSLYVEVQAGTKALGGFVLKDKRREITSVPEFPKELQILGKGAVLALNGERKVLIKTRGAHHLRYTLARIPSAQVNHLARFAKGDFESPQFYSEGIDESNIAHFYREVKPVAAANEYEAVYTAFDFSQALAAPDPADLDASRGLFIFKVEAVKPLSEKEADDDDDDESDNPDPLLSKWIRVPTERQALDDDDYNESDRGTRRLVLITDLGLIVKRESDGSRHVFVQSISRQEPQPGASIIVMAKNGEHLVETQTDADGHARLPDVEAFKREKTAVAITARVGNDLAFIPFAKPDRVLDFSRFDTGGVLASQKDELDAYLFTERGVYRPGDPIHVSGIVRRRDWSGKLDGLPLRLAMTNAKHETVRSQRFNLASDGFFEGTFTTRESDPTGKYYLDVALVLAAGDEQPLGMTAVRVEDFQPDRMKMTLTLNSPPELAWVQPRDISADIGAQTLFGFPAAARKVKAKLELSPADFSFPGFESFIFHHRGQLKLRSDDDDSEAQDDDFAGKRVDLGETKTDAEGKAKFDLQLERFDSGCFSLSVVAEAFEADGGRGVQGSVSTLVAPMPYVIGFKPEGDLGYIAKDSVRAIKIIGLDPKLKGLAIPGLTARLYYKRYVSVLTKQDNGSYEYVSTLRETAAPDVPFALPAEGATHSLATKDAGDFRLELRNPENIVVLSCNYTVVGKGESERSLERDAELELKLARGSYLSGESIDLSLRSSYTGAGLITIERESVLAWHWFKSPTTASTQSIVVPPGFEGTGYVNVAFVRALDSPEIFMSPLSYAVEPFVANADRHKLAVTLDAPAKVKPGEALRIGYTTATPGRVIVFAVDEGIHNITNYKLPQPLSHFIRKRALETETHQLLDLILPEQSLLSKKAFGGGEDPGLKVHMNPFKRRKDAPVVFWSGLVASGPKRREVTYNVPDYFDGNLKIMAVAVSADMLGGSEIQSLVRGPFVLTPNVPTFAAPGDEFTVSLTLANNLEGNAASDPANATVSLATSASAHLQLLDGNTQSLAVAPGHEATARLRVKALDNLGGAEIAFTASAGGETTRRAATLSVRPAAPYLTEVQSGYFRLKTQDVKLQRQLYPHLRKAEATVSALPLGLARGLERYLREYPHGCTEQITSRVMSRLLLASEVDFGFNAGESASAIAEAMSLLIGRQRDDGGFGYWSGFGGDGSPNDYLSIYVAHFLTEAKEASHEVPESLLEGALKFLRSTARAKLTSLDQADTQAAAIYLLTRHGTVTTNAIVNLRDSLTRDYRDQWKSRLCAAYMAATYALLKKESEAEALMSAHWATLDRKAELGSWSGWYYEEPLVKRAQSFALVCRHFPDMAKDFGYEEVSSITQPIAQNHFNTLSAAHSILALKAYSKLVAATDMKTSISAMLAGVAEPQLILPAGQGVRAASFDVSTSGLRFHLDKGSTDLGAFYQVTESGYDRSATLPALADGLEVSRDFIDEKGQPLAKLRIGQGAAMRLRILNNSPQAQRQIALLDLMPGGFEIENGSLRPGTDTVPGADYVDVREDRNVFYLSLNKGESRTFTYRLKPICAGSFVVPPVFAECMYDRGVKGRAGAGKIEVEP